MSIDNKLNELKTVLLPKSGTNKFVLVKVTDGQNDKDVLIATPWRKYHGELLSNYRKNLGEGLKVEKIHGGGRVWVNECNIHVYGRSTAFGMAPQELVKQLFEEHFLDTVVKYKIEMGKGY